MRNDHKPGGFKKLFLWIAAFLGGFPLNVHGKAEPVAGKYGGSYNDMNQARRKACEAIAYNIGLMDEALARYQAVLAQEDARNTVEAATALRKIYQGMRAGLVPVDAGILPAELAEKTVLAHEVFQELSLVCHAADMSALLGDAGFGAGFETLTTVYSPGSNMFQPQANRISDEQYAEFLDSARYFEEVKAELMDLLDYYGRKT